MTMIHENLNERRRKAADVSPSELLINLHRRFRKNEMRDEIIARFVDKCAEGAVHQALVISIVTDWASLNYNRLTRAEPTREEKAAAKVREAEAIKQSMGKFEQNMLMKVALPLCGKRLEDATFAECRKEGGWLSRVGKMGKSHQIVGKTLSEKDLRAAL